MNLYFVGAGPGDVELLTVKAYRLIEEADCIIYAGSLINKSILSINKRDCEYFDSSRLNLDEIINIIENYVSNNKKVIRLASGEPSIYGAILEQMIELDNRGIEYETVPGISSLFAVSSKLKIELTAPEVSQTVIITRVEGRTKKPKGESINIIAEVKGTHVYFLSIDKIAYITERYIEHHWSENTPVAVVYDVTGVNEKIVYGELKNIASLVAEQEINKKALIIIGEILNRKLNKYSRLYDKKFFHGYRPK
ncbi:MAG: precorrin-4 C(11)-methyltransferase [Deferribacterota bacterium]|nr:precorrin-4 C(11)-methyltransferase [Deferribacterota bacterium]